MDFSKKATNHIVNHKSLILKCTVTLSPKINISPKRNLLQSKTFIEKLLCYGPTQILDSVTQALIKACILFKFYPPSLSFPFLCQKSEPVHLFEFDSFITDGNNRKKIYLAKNV